MNKQANKLATKLLRDMDRLEFPALVSLDELLDQLEAEFTAMIPPE